MPTTGKLKVMVSIDAELLALIEKLHAEEIPYALCGALALAVYGYPRATLDIDLLALAGSSERILRCGRSLGFSLEAAPVQFAQGAVRITRLCKVLQGNEEVLMLDVLSVAAEIESGIIVDTLDWRDALLQIVSRASLIRLKKLRGRTQDLADLEKLSE